MLTTRALRSTVDYRAAVAFTCRLRSMLASGLAPYKAYPTRWVRAYIRRMRVTALAASLHHSPI